MSLSEQQNLRYSRQIRLDEFSHQGQEKIKSASVLIIGAGGLGSPVALYLAAAGVGHIGIIDFDTVDLTNLQRQILYKTSDIGKTKANLCKKILLEFNPEIDVTAYTERLTAKNADFIFKDYDFIVDAADNFATRYLVSDASFLSQKILISASILGFEGQLGVFNIPGGPCYRCLYPEPPPTGTVPSCNEAGVLGSTCGVFGSLQASEVLKLIITPHRTEKFFLLQAHLLHLEFNVFEIFKNPDCKLCGPKAEIHEVNEKNFVCSLDSKIKEITYLELLELKKIKNIKILDVRESSEFIEGHIESSLHIPLAQIENQLEKISQESPVIVYCRSGVRSFRACEFLQQKGFEVYNLKGGIKDTPIYVKGRI